MPDTRPKIHSFNLRCPIKTQLKSVNVLGVRSFYVKCRLDLTYTCYISTAVEIGIFIEPLDLPSHKLVFFAVNDNDSTDSAGGSHWYNINET